MKLFKGQLGLFNRTHSDGVFSDHTWVIASWHSNKSITWSWALKFSKPFRVWLSTQETMRKETD